ncbi:Cof-type HAD-IIB family hydrolase [Spiroplasma turonicum]|uniref:HAD superfamily hydrolase n=1 Tax=Spiroplasma turonicum TaxID=216946 RepID=A0A0K1P512_9MOLU|nr:Cof-type HAD-IIB family hydrolase [Spiroplasma turonicum]AKU79368.1 HAD superfamily hydrolase [Spiroplasma turonicum]ALX70389.1 HAD superfamily hydrolase [Spiroplasma turonicum]
MSKIKLIAMDIDGTVLGKGHVVSKKTLDILDKARNSNIKVCLATGRHILRTKNIAESIKSHLNGDYVVCLNGGGLYKFENNNINTIFEVTFTVEEFDNIYKKAKELNVNCWSYDKKDNTSTVLKRNLFTFALSKLSGRKSIVYKNDIKTLSYKLICNGKGKNIKKFKDYLNSSGFRYYDWSYSDSSKRIEVCPKGINKSYALNKILELENINLNEVAFFGDGDNDKELLKLVGYGVAMGNAHEEVKKHATHITLKNTEDGIYEFLKDYIQ